MSSLLTMKQVFHLPHILGYRKAVLYSLILVNYDPAYTLREGGCLADIIPTMIEMMGMEQPAEMTGKSLLIKK